jgi:hypothetical protein
MSASSGARLLAAILACGLALKYSLGAMPLREIPVREIPVREIPASGGMDFMIFTIAPPLAVKAPASRSGLDALSDNASGMCCSISDADRATPPAGRDAGSRCEAPAGAQRA